MLAGVWTWVRLPPAPLFFHQPWKNVVKSTFFIFAFGIPWQSFVKKDTTKDTTFLLYPQNNFSFLRKTWDSNPRTLLHAYRVSNTAS